MQSVLLVMIAIKCLVTCIIRPADPEDENHEPIRSLPGLLLHVPV